MKRFICVLLIALLCVGFAACSKKPSNTEPASGATSDSVSSADPQAEATQGSDASSSAVSSAAGSNAAAKQYKTVKEYLETPQVKSEVDASVEKNTNDTMSMSVYAEGDDTLVYDYAFKQTYGESEVPALKASLDDSLEKNASTFQDVVTSLGSYISVESPKVKVIYRNGDESVITERTYE